jgi:hypothetical protein
MAVYTDRAHWAFNTPQASGPINRRLLTQVGRALERLGIEHIPAYSPQARGRSERLNRTFQDRLVNELRIANSRRSRRPMRICANASSPTTTRPSAARRPTRRVPSCRWARWIWNRFSVTRRSVSSRATTPWRSRVARSSCPATRSSLVRRPAGDRPPPHGRILDLVRGAPLGLVSGRPRAPARSPNGGAACGSCRCGGRQERAHRTLENAKRAFPTAPTVLPVKSGQITCQTKADRSLVNNRLPSLRSALRGLDPHHALRTPWHLLERRPGPVVRAV